MAKTPIVQFNVPIGCNVCGFLDCVCDIIANHEEGCKYRVSATCAVAIECDHGRDVCPICDPCTCGKRIKLGRLC